MSPIPPSTLALLRMHASLVMVPSGFFMMICVLAIAGAVLIPREGGFGWVMALAAGSVFSGLVQPGLVSSPSGRQPWPYLPVAADRRIEMGREIAVTGVILMLSLGFVRSGDARLGDWIWEAMIGGWAAWTFTAWGAAGKGKPALVSGLRVLVALSLTGEALLCAIAAMSAYWTSTRGGGASFQMLCLGAMSASAASIMGLLPAGPLLGNFQYRIGMLTWLPVNQGLARVGAAAVSLLYAAPILAMGTLGAPDPRISGALVAHWLAFAAVWVAGVGIVLAPPRRTPFRGMLPLAVTALAALGLLAFGPILMMVYSRGDLHTFPAELVLPANLVAAGLLSVSLFATWLRWRK